MHRVLQITQSPCAYLVQRRNTLNLKTQQTVSAQPARKINRALDNDDRRSVCRDFMAKDASEEVQSHHSRVGDDDF